MGARQHKPDNTQATEEQNKVTGDTKQKEIEQFNTFLNDLNHYRELLDTHRRWVDADDAWKKARKDHNQPHGTLCHAHPIG